MGHEKKMTPETRAEKLVCHSPDGSEERRRGGPPEADVVGVTEQTHAVSPCDGELEDDNEDEPMVGPQRPSTLENIKKDSGGCDVVNRKELPTTTHIVEREGQKPTLNLQA